jgi:hypothetical protein
MISYREEIVQSWVRSEPSSRSLAALLGLGLPVTLRDIVLRLRQVETINLSAPINTDDDTPIRGHVAMELHSDGAFVFSGHMRATGFTSYHFAVQAFVGSADGTVIAAQRTGRVFGTDTPGPDLREWTEPGNNPGIIEGWRVLRASPSLGFHFQADISGVLGAAIDVLKFAIKGIATNVVLGPYGWYVTIGNELIGMDNDLASPDILGGILVGGAVFLIVGPCGLIPAIILGAGTAVLADIRHRTLRSDEQDWARRVFGDKIRYDDIVVTNMLGADERKFTIPYVGNKILMGLGPAFDEPTTWADLTNDEYKEPGSVFVHEMTHAWQVCNTSLIRVICNTSGDYAYAGDANWASRGWRSFNNEQQAHIVDDWFGRHYTALDSLAALRDPAYRYIRDNILPGVG